MELRRSIKILSRAALFFSIAFTSYLSAGTTFYVQSPAAKLLDNPSMNSGGKQIPKGSSLQQIGEKDMFLKVKSNIGDGFILKLYVSSFPPGGKVGFGNEIDKSTSVKGRARASAYTETAAARGLAESENLRTRGEMADYDFGAIDWLETVTLEQEQ
ncbi:MAG: hypothetical protein K8R21_14030 [Leptospira sp.]|nr:hypothetical protein [Leptospira sp.]